MVPSQARVAQHPTVVDIALLAQPWGYLGLHAYVAWCILNRFAVRVYIIIIDMYSHLYIQNDYTDNMKHVSKEQ